MTDPNLLEQAKTAGAALLAAEQQVLLARADYHTAIRRLHLAGASLRDVAQVLSLSHQRVQQIVSAAGGSWWPVWRTRTRSGDMLCTWCDRPPSAVAKLIAGPGIFICDACIEAAERVVRGARRATDIVTAAPDGTRPRCTFCRKRADTRRSIVVGPANICSECLHVCREILDGRAA